MSKRPSLNIYIGNELADQIRANSDVNWSAVCRAAIERRLAELEAEERALGPRIKSKDK